MVTYRWLPQDSTTTGYLYVPGISSSTFPWLSDFLSEFYRFFFFFFFLFFTFSSPCFRFLIRKITCVSVTSAGLSYSVFTGISCLEIHYLSKKVGTVSIRYRKIHFNFNPTCSLTIYNMSGDFGDCMQTECVWLVYCVSNVSVNAT